jgi:deazaflavin-dependent oxidoreductase (nitroreductase family)
MSAIWEGGRMDTPAVEDAPPPQNALRFMNPLIKAVLRSPLHRLLDKNMMLLTVTGRKTGRTYTLPVWRHESPDGALVLSAGGAWRHNLRGGADVRITVDGRERPARAVLEEDPARAAEVFRTLLERAGARAVAVKVNVDRTPTAAEIAPLMADRGVAYVTFGD